MRGTLALGETVVIETIGGADNDFEAAGETRAGMITSGESHRRYARRGGPFRIEGIAPDDWVAIEIIDIEVGPYGFYRNGGPNWGNWRCVAPVRDGLIHFPPDFVVPVRPMVGVVQLEPWAAHSIDHGGNMDFNAGSAGQYCAYSRPKARGLALSGRCPCADGRWRVDRCRCRDRCGGYDKGGSLSPGFPIAVQWWRRLRW